MENCCHLNFIPHSRNNVLLYTHTSYRTAALLIIANVQYRLYYCCYGVSDRNTKCVSAWFGFSDKATLIKNTFLNCSFFLVRAFFYSLLSLSLPRCNSNINELVCVQFSNCDSSASFNFCFCSPRPVHLAWSAY